MRRHPPKLGILVGLICLVSGYLMVAIAADLLHNHDSDARFHDNCPACQWTQQAFEDDSVLQGMIAALEQIQAATPETAFFETDQTFNAVTLPTPLTYRGPPAPAV